MVIRSVLQRETSGLLVTNSTQNSFKVLHQSH